MSFVVFFCRFYMLHTLLPIRWYFVNQKRIRLNTHTSRTIYNAGT